MDFGVLRKIKRRKELVDSGYSAEDIVRIMADEGFYLNTSQKEIENLPPQGSFMVDEVGQSEPIQQDEEEEDEEDDGGSDESDLDDDEQDDGAGEENFDDDDEETPSIIMEGQNMPSPEIESIVDNLRGRGRPKKDVLHEHTPLPFDLPQKMPMPTPGVTQRIASDDPAYAQIILRKNGKLYRMRSSTMAFFMPEDWLRFYGSLSFKQRPLFAWLMATGARYAEVKGITMRDVNINNKYVTLRKTKVRAKLGEKKPKPRVVALSNQFISDVKRMRRDFRVKLDDHFPMMSSSGANDLLKSRLHKLNISDWKLFAIHNIRKTHETWLLALDIPIGKVAKRLGHSSGVALSNYISEDIFTPDDKRKIRAVIGNLYAPDPSQFASSWPKIDWENYKWKNKQEDQQPV